MEAPEPDIRLMAASSPDFAHALAIRHRVFVSEQGVPEAEELDADEDRSLHLLLFLDGTAAGTLRFFDDDGWLHIGRLAVLAEYRGLGIGRRLLERGIEEGRKRGFRRAFLNAQSDKIDFYRRFGFVASGEEFPDAGIPHLRMEREL